MRQQYIWEPVSLLSKFSRFTHFHSLQPLPTPQIATLIQESGVKEKIYYVGPVLLPFSAFFIMISQSDQYLLQKTNPIKYNISKGKVKSKFY